VGARGDDCTEFWGQSRTESVSRAAVIV
jgi:hypothetical protein